LFVVKLNNVATKPAFAHDFSTKNGFAAPMAVTTLRNQPGVIEYCPLDFPGLAGYRHLYQRKANS
jgi:hypothetical protein